MLSSQIIGSLRTHSVSLPFRDLGACYRCAWLDNGISKIALTGDSAGGQSGVGASVNRLCTSLHGYNAPVAAVVFSQ